MRKDKSFNDMKRIYDLNEIGTDICEECGKETIIYEQNNSGGVIIEYCSNCDDIYGDVIETNSSRFKELEEAYYLEEVCDEECPMCSGTLKFYESKYIEGANVRYCYRCDELEEDFNIDLNQDNICEVCEEIVSYEDDDINNYMCCNCCGKKVHISCINEVLCSNCNIWICDKHLLENSDKYFKCSVCDSIHKLSCINNKSKYLDDESERVCDKCYERVDDILKQVKSTVTNKNILDNIDKNSKFYVTEARENSDLTIMLTHLVKGDNSYDVLKSILDKKKLIATETGYYKHTEKTKAVCFADLTTKGLLRHSKKYSVYGIAFLKEVIFNKGGGPVLYINDKYLSEFNIPNKIKPFINKINLENYDFHHEREWRLPIDFEFEHSEIAVLYAPLKNHDELRKLYPNIKNILDIDFLQLI